MIIFKNERKIIYENLFKEGVLVAEKDYNKKHFELDVDNLKVIKACQSLTSRGLVKTQFSWQWYYYTPTNEGIEYLREFLHLPSEIVPATHKRPPRQAGGGRPGGAPGGGAREGAYRPPRGDGEYRDRGDYRRRDDGEKKDGAPGEFKPRFSGIGRGGPRPE